MKLLRSFIAAFCIAAALCTPTLSKAGEVNVNGFLVDASVINYMFNNGAQAIKIYAAADEAGNLYYILTGADAEFNTMGGQVYKQNYKGDCPPSCDFLPSSLSGGGAYIDADGAEGMVNNYMGTRTGVSNCVKLTKASLDKVRTAYPFMKITFGSSVTITPLKSDGTAATKSAVSDSGNSAGYSGM